MADEFWNKVYDRLVDNFELLKLIGLDTSNADLLSWSKPNLELWRRLLPFVQRGSIVNKQAFIDEMLKYALTNKPLRRIVLLTWVDKNPTPMSFFKVAGNKENFDRLSRFEFGDVNKIRILSLIDPRDGVAKAYKEVLDKVSLKEVIPLLEEKSIDSKGLSEFSNAELEAALCSKVIVSAADNKNESHSGNFNDVVMEELSKIKAALEILQDVNKQLKNDNKALREQEAKRKTEISNYSGKLEKTVKENKRLNSQLDQEKNVNSSLSKQLETAKAEIAKKPDFKKLEYELNDLRYRQDGALKECSALREALSNREASLDRLRKENLELKSKVGFFENQEKLISSLRQKLEEFQGKSSKEFILIAGQLVTKTRFGVEAGEKAGRKCWLFVSVTGEFYYLDLSEIPKVFAVPEQYLLLTFEEGRVVEVSSLEKESREVYGFVKLKEGRGVLSLAEGEELPICLEITEKWVNRPARGFFLPELENRSAGVYKIEILPDSASGKVLEAKSSKKGSDRVTEKEILESKRFNGEKVAVFGGDRVGLEYEKALNSLGLEAKWFSGFSLLSEISLGGFGKPDLIIIVTKQVSHALLRELNAYAEKNSIRVAYSTRRGVKAVLALATSALS